jgi:hypothetical protein
VGHVRLELRSVREGQDRLGFVSEMGHRHPDITHARSLDLEKRASVGSVAARTHASDLLEISREVSLIEVSQVLGESG